MVRFSIGVSQCAEFMEILSRMFSSWIFIVYYLSICFQLTATQDDCSPIYVRWNRVRLNLTARVAGPYSLDNCTKSCNRGDNPARPGFPIECAGFNHKQGANSLSHECELFQRDQLQNNVDGHIESSDRYAFYWKYCAKTKKVCKSPYQFDFFIDRFMDSSEIQRTINTDRVEDCLSRCLDETDFTCRSISFNRTANICSLSPQSQISKPGYLRVNNNPNYRIDYYENNCYNESFTFHHDCRDNGIVVSVESKFQYTGALYGLYDFFTCRIEPKNETRFSLFFPYSSYSKNCTDSFSQKEGNNVLDVVLSTDGMEPLYFLTDQDLLYKAQCPVNNDNIGHLPLPSTIGATVVFLAPPITTTTSQFESSSQSISTSTASTTQSRETSTITSSSFSASTSSSSTHSSSSEATSTSETSATSDPDKKPFVTLPIIDFTPKVEKIDPDVFIPNRGSKIMVVVKYPHNDLFHETDEASSFFETSTEKITSTEATSFKSTPTAATTSIEVTSSSASTSTTSTPTSTTASTSSFTSSTSTTPTTSKSASTTTSTTPTTSSTPTSRSTVTTPDSSTVEISTRIPSRKFPDIIHLESKIDVDNSVEFSASDRIPHVTQSRIILSSSSSEKPTSTISPRSSSSSSTWSSSLKSTTATPETTRSSTTATTSEPLTTRTTTSTSTGSTETPFISRFDPFGGAKSNLPSTATSTTSTQTSSPTRRFGTEFSLDRTTTGQSLSTIGTNASTTGTTKSVLTNSTTTLPPTTTAPQKVLFDVFHNSQPVSAVVVGSRITLNFASGLGVPASYISLVGCQVEPVNSPYSRERDPLQIVKNGCQADGVGLVCPPTRTEFGVKVEMEAFRYTTTSEVLYSCLVRVCAFNPCPQPFCNAVDGCESPNAALPVLINSRGRRKRQQFPVPTSFSNLGPSFQVPGAFQQNLLGSAGDIVVSKKLVVVNSENELQYYLRTGNVPTAGASFNGFGGR